MKIDYASFSQLEDIHFKYERICSLISCLQSVVSEIAEVRGLPEHAVDYSLYELEIEIDRNNKKLYELIHGAKYIKEEAAS